MDIFSLEDDGVATYHNGAVINDLTTKLWIERFREPGEFTFTGPPTKELRDALKIGTLISHTNTLTVMIVEDHEINETKGEDPVLTITGRDAGAFLEQRIATDDDLGFDPSAADGSAHPYTMPDAKPWDQAIRLMNQQISTIANRATFIIPHVSVIDRFPIRPGDKEAHPDWFDTDEREVKRGPLSQAVIAILHEIDGGLLIERPVQGSHENIWFVVARGIDRQHEVQFSYEAGDIETARYFWSDKSKKNAAYVAARYQGKFVLKSGFSGWARRVSLVDANDFNINPGEAGWAGVSQAAKLDAMLTRRGNIRIRRAKSTELVEATISRSNQYVYRRDYNVGDEVWVTGNYDVSKAMRVSEFAETEDETGEFGFPTLSTIQP
jgi:hypothetical protein